VGGSYYNRTSRVHTDGTLVYETEEDHQQKLEVADYLERPWNCLFKDMGRLSPVDFVVNRHERPSAVVEVKCRPHPLERYPTAWCNDRKYDWLLSWSAGLRVPGFFVLKFTDGVFWINVKDIPPDTRMGGCRKLVKSTTDIEPVHDIPLDLLHRVK